MFEWVRHPLHESFIISAPLILCGLKHALQRICRYSGSDIRAVCQEASMGPIRDVPEARLVNANASEISPILYSHFEAAVQRIRPSVCDHTFSPFILARYSK